MASSARSAGLVVIGGGAAGHACVAAYRDHGGVAPITLVSADDRHPYFRPHLTKALLTGDVPFDDIGLESDEWYEARDVDVRLSCRATAVDMATRTVATDHDPVAFDQLVLATGSRAARLPIPGVDHPRVFTIRAAADSLCVRDAIESGEPVLVIGSGFVGCEAAASMTVRGLDVTMVSMEPVAHADRLGLDAGKIVSGWLSDLGVRLHAGRGVQRLDHGSLSTRAVLDDETTIESGWVIMATGAEPNIELADTIGLTVDGAVPVDASMRTLAPGVFAAGDIVSAFNPTAGRALRVEHWGDAERMGAVAGTVAAGSDDTWSQVPGFWSQIAGRQLKYVAWGDGWDQAVFQPSNGGFTIWYGRNGRHVGVLTHEHDEDLDLGRKLIETAAPFHE